ncbi:MAG: SOS response-associated peptidase [Gammaproteobacteria bacterium]
MCGRFNLITDAQGIVAFFNVLHCPELQPRYNIAPTQDIPAVVWVDGEREVIMLRWGLVPSWSKDPSIGQRLINAKAETVAGKPAFRAVFRRRRCLIPASGFYEWQAKPGGKQPWNICRSEGGLMALAGLWEHWDSGGRALRTCTILTTDANPTVAPIHGRMPVILQPEVFDAWLQPDTSPQLLQELLHPCPENYLRAYPVDRYVNSPAHDDERCIEPLDGAP